MEDTVKVVQRNRLQWCDDAWVKCVTLEAEGARQTGGPKKTWIEDMNDLHIEPGDAVLDGKIRKMVIIIMLFI